MNYIASKIVLLFAIIAVKVNSDYLRDCVEHLRRYLLDNGYEVKYHWQWITLPTVRRVFSTMLPKESITPKPMELPSGLMFTLDWEDK